VEEIEFDRFNFKFYYFTHTCTSAGIVVDY